MMWPMWAGLSAEARQSRWREVVEAAEARYPAPSRVLGAAGVLRVEPHDRPEKSKRGPAPAVHASSRAQRMAWWRAYRAFVGNASPIYIPRRSRTGHE